MMKSKSFYEVFIDECSEPTLLIGSFVTNEQKQLIEEATFLNEINECNYKREAREIITILEDYNRRLPSYNDDTNEEIVQEYHVLNKQKGERLRQNEIKTAEHFLALVNNQKRTFRSLKSREDIETLKPLVENLIVNLKNADICLYISKTIQTKTPLKNKISKIINKYNIKSATKQAKHLIDKLGNY